MAAFFLLPLGLGLPDCSSAPACSESDKQGKRAQDKQRTGHHTLFSARAGHTRRVHRRRHEGRRR